MRHLRLTLALLAAAAALLIPPGCDKHAEDKAAIRAVWDGLSMAHNARDGRTIVESMTFATFPYYDRLVKLAVSGTRQDIERLTLVERYQVIEMRHRTDAKTLEGMSGRDFLIYSTKEGWRVDEEDVEGDWLQLGEIIIDSDYARARAIIDGEKTGHWVHFIREDQYGQPSSAGLWKLDDPQLDTLFNAFIPVWAKARGIHVEDMILVDLRDVTRRPVRRDILDLPTVKK